MPSNVPSSVPTGQGQGSGPTVQVPGWALPDTSAASHGDERSTGEDGDEPVTVLWTQFSDWCSHDSSSQRNRGLSDKNTGAVEEFGLSGVCEDSQGPVGIILCETLLAKKECIIICSSCV